jgi:G3E family GTPase
VLLEAVLDRGAFDLSRILEIEPGLLEEEDDHEHDDTIVSVSLTARAPVNAERFSGWIRPFIIERGVDILRCKGILNLTGQDNRYVFQGVHMVMDSAWAGPWTDGDRTSRLVFIGRNLDAAELDAAFQSCVDAA